MSDAPVKKNATYADLMELPENVVGEIIGGNLYATPRPRWRHGQLASALTEQVRAGVGRKSQGPGGWVIVPEPELHLDPDIVVPDLGGWRRERASSITPDAPWVEVAPDWVCEILSPSTVRRDRVQKLPIYVRAGVGHAWIVDPDAQMLEVLRRDGEVWVLATTHAGEARVSIEPFTTAEFDLSEWWLP